MTDEVGVASIGEGGEIELDAGKLLSVLRLHRLQAGRVKFSIQLSPWTAAFSVAEKQLVQHGRRGIVIRGVMGSEDKEAHV